MRTEVKNLCNVHQASKMVLPESSLSLLSQKLLKI